MRPPLFYRHLLGRFAMALKHKRPDVFIRVYELRRCNLTAAELIADIGDGWTYAQHQDGFLFTRSQERRA
jgi:hypothetical protein